MNKFIFILKGVYLYGILTLWALLICSVDSLYDKDILIICVGSMFVLSYIGKFFLLLEELEIYTSWNLIRSILCMKNVSIANRIDISILRIVEDKDDCFKGPQIPTALTTDERIILILCLLKALRPYRWKHVNWSTMNTLSRILVCKIRVRYLHKLSSELIFPLSLPELRGIDMYATNAQKYDMLQSVFRRLINKRR